ncbi:MAG: T9SS type A sorting domain-containing protein [Rhodothermia bacterium]|nr:T9SS type A sorting domain-containing protein [Rhodothermia bacterium]
MSISGGSAAFVSDGLGGNVILEWDGDSDTATYNETGLSGVDLTMDAGGMAQVGLKFDVVSTGPYTVNVVVSTSDRLASSSLVSGVGPEQVTMLFTDFVDEGPDGGADFTNVGAVLMNFAGNSSFSIGGVETCPDPGLPVELASFDAVTSGSVVELRWVVASQVDNAGFEVEHKFASQASDWEVVDFVPSTGNSDTDVHYTLRTDVQVAGRHQFRLRMIDLDGSFSYSPMTEVSVDVPGSFVLGKAYPNPFNPSTSFTLSLAKGQNISIALYDLLGRRVKELHNGYLDGEQSHQFRLDAADLSTGIYMIKAAGQFEAASEMVTLVK